MTTKDEVFDQTTGDIARAAEVLPDLVRKYADLGLIEFRRLSDRTRVFRKSAGAQVKAIRAKRMAAPRRRAKEVCAS